MSAPTQKLPTSSDPAEIFTRQDLVLALDRLRRNAASATSRPRVSYAWLASRTQMPASTLHTYLTGASFPSSEALDRIILALGVPADEAPAWASAWQSVADTTFAGGQLPGAGSNGRLSRLRENVRDQLTSAGKAALDNSHYVVLANRMTIGADRVIHSLEHRVTIRATGPGVDRDYLQISSGTDQALDAIRLCGLHNCVAGRHRTLTEPATRVLEIRFDHELQIGETYSYGATVRYGITSLIDEEPARCALKGFLSSGTTFSLDVEFPKAHPPSRVLQVRRPSYNKGDEIVVAELAVNTWGMATMVVEHAVAGVHGMRWEW